MKKYVFMNYGEGYQKCIINAIKNDDQTYYFKKFESNFLKKLFFLHNAWPLSKKIEFPLKRIWFRRCMEGVNVTSEEEIYFLLYESFHLTYSRAFLKYIKKNYKNAKLCYIFSNIVDEYNMNKIRKIQKYLDAIITFNKKDAKQHNFLYYPLQPYKIPIYANNPDKESDLFFIGSDKGRLDKLISIFEKVSLAGFSCDFYIVGVPKEKQKYKEIITYNQRLTYEEVLRKVASTKCVLELIKNSENYISIRTIEAMKYHKQLLTDSLASRDFDFYDEHIIQIFSDVESINTDFLKIEPEQRLYDEDKFCYLQAFKDYLCKNVK